MALVRLKNLENGNLVLNLDLFSILAVEQQKLDILLYLELFPVVMEVPVV